MIDKKFYEVYNKFKLNFYRNILSSIENKKEDLTIAESFCLEAIYVLGNPTIGQLVKFLKVAQPNITYRVNCLVKKGFVVKVHSQEDKRVVILNVTDKYYKFQKEKNTCAKNILKATKESLTSEEKKALAKVLTIMSDQLNENINDKLK